MTDHTRTSDLSTLDARRGSTEITLSEDASSYRCVRVFGAPPARVFRAFTDPADLRVWFPSGAPEGSEMTKCESDAVDGGRYHYILVIPEHGPMAWHGTYTHVDRPDRLDADEWFVMGEDDPTGDPTSQTLTFEPTGEGFKFGSAVVGGSIPSQYIPAVESGVRQVMESGALYGFPMQDVSVTVYDGKFHAVDSKEIAFVQAGKKAFLDAVKKANHNTFFLAHGGPINTPDDVRYALAHTTGLHGFVGASSLERMGVEQSLTNLTKEFKSITL